MVSQNETDHHVHGQRGTLHNSDHTDYTVESVIIEHYSIAETDDQRIYVLAFAEKRFVGSCLAISQTFSVIMTRQKIIEFTSE